MTLVSVILPVYNGEKYLQRALNSIEAQTFKDYELIIIDDGSTDNTWKIIASYAASIFYQEHAGLSKALNFGLEEAWGKYVCFIAHDDWWHPDKLLWEIRYMEHEKVGVVYSDFYNVDGDKVTVHRCPEYNEHPLTLWNYINIGASMIHKLSLDVLKESDGYVFDESLVSCMDGDLWIRLSKICDFKHIPLPLAYYFRHPGQLSNTEEHRKQRIKMYGVGGIDYN